MEVLPLVKNHSREYAPGWCTYSDDFNDLPEVEFFCGGINSKTPTAAGLWRQGHLFHFGFEQSPAEMNETGQALLLNSIAYISRFKEDRPIAVTPSVFAGPVASPRTYPANIIHREDRDLGDLQHYLSSSTFASIKEKDRAACRQWLEEVRGFLSPGKDNKLTVDPEAQTFGVPFDRPEFFTKAIAALGEGGDNSERARRLLNRYAPVGPANGGTEQWMTWWKVNQPYLFFSDAGGFRWYVDPLAKKRAIPSAKLRGPARATTSGTAIANR